MKLHKFADFHDGKHLALCQKAHPETAGKLQTSYVWRGVTCRRCRAERKRGGAIDISRVPGITPRMLDPRRRACVRCGMNLPVILLERAKISGEWQCKSSPRCEAMREKLRGWVQHVAIEAKRKILDAAAIEAADKGLWVKFGNPKDRPVTLLAIADQADQGREKGGKR